MLFLAVRSVTLRLRDFKKKKLSVTTKFYISSVSLFDNFGRMMRVITAAFEIVMNI